MDSWCFPINPRSGMQAGSTVASTHGRCRDSSSSAGIDVGPSPQWLTATPDSQTLYVSMVGSMETVALNTNTHEIVARIPVGFGPKRNSTHTIPIGTAR